MRAASVQCLLLPPNMSCPLNIGSSLAFLSPDTAGSFLAHSLGRRGKTEDKKLGSYNWVRVGTEKARAWGVHAFELLTALRSTVGERELFV